jgi:NADH-quinone oxidoreductase subunit J
MNDPTFQAFLFWVVAILTGACAVAVVVTQNIVRAATYLLFALAGTSGIFFLLGADFVGATQLLVYVGGTLVLVVFGVMLTAQGPFISMKTGAAEWAIALVVGLMLYATLAISIVNRGQWEVAGRKAGTGMEASPGQATDSVVLGEALLGVTKATPQGYLTGARYAPPPESAAQAVANGGAPAKLPNSKTRTEMAYLFPFEIVSIHLLVVLIGAAYLARAKRRRGEIA